MKIPIRGGPVVPIEQMGRNREHANSLGLTKLEDVTQTKKGKLAVVGGGPSVREHLPTLKKWDGEIWSINGACTWLRNNGVQSTFFSVDALPMVADQARGAAKAIVATQCDPSVFEALGNADIVLWENKVGVVSSGASTVTATPVIAATFGFEELTFFGCESSYPPNNTHAYHHEPRALELTVRCPAFGGVDYLTAPDFYLQAQEIGAIIREFPSVYKEESGGLLRAIIKYGDDHDVPWVSRALDQIVKANLQSVA